MMEVSGREEIGKVECPWVSSARSIWRNGQSDWAPALHRAEVRNRVLQARPPDSNPGGFAT